LYGDVWFVEIGLVAGVRVLPGDETALYADAAYSSRATRWNGSVLMIKCSPKVIVATLCPAQTLSEMMRLP